MGDDKVRRLTEVKKTDPVDGVEVDEEGGVHRWRVNALDVEADSAPNVEVTFTFTATFSRRIYETA